MTRAFVEVGAGIPGYGRTSGLLVGVCRRSSAIAAAKSSSRAVVMMADGKTTVAKVQSKFAERLNKALEGLGRGIERQITEQEEATIDDIVEEMENTNKHPSPFGDPKSRGLVDGEWRLIYSNSTTTRFTNGFSGAHAVLPQGRSADIRMELDLTFNEIQIFEDLAFFPNQTMTAVANGKMVIKGDNKYNWDPEAWRLGFIKNGASGNRPIRSFCVGEITYVDENYRVDRGTTDQIHLWQRLA